MKKWITVLVVGIILALGPLWGLAGTISAMISMNGRIKSEEADVRALSKDISLALDTTVAGFVAFPIGVALVIAATIKVVKGTQQAEKVEAT